LVSSSQGSNNTIEDNENTSETRENETSSDLQRSNSLIGTDYNISGGKEENSLEEDSIPLSKQDEDIADNNEQENATVPTTTPIKIESNNNKVQSVYAQGRGGSLRSTTQRSRAHKRNKSFGFDFVGFTFKPDSWMNLRTLYEEEKDYFSDNDLNIKFQ
jgi:hypothetical protein